MGFSSCLTILLTSMTWYDYINTILLSYWVVVCLVIGYVTYKHIMIWVHQDHIAFLWGCHVPCYRLSCLQACHGMIISRPYCFPTRLLCSLISYVMIPWSLFRWMFFTNKIFLGSSHAAFWVPFPRPSFAYIYDSSLFPSYIIYGPSHTSLSLSCSSCRLAALFLSNCSLRWKISCELVDCNGFLPISYHALTKLLLSPTSP